MDRNTVLGFLLIGLVLMVWMYLNAPPPKPVTLVPDDTTAVDTSAAPPHDSAGAARQQGQTPARESAAVSTAEVRDSLGTYFSRLANGKEREITIETGKYTARLSTRGGSIVSWALKEFLTWDQHTVDLINDKEKGELNLLFQTTDGKLINTRSLAFTVPSGDQQRYTLTGTDSLALDLVLPVTATSRIVKTLVFHNENYDVTLRYRFENMESIIANYEYQVTWETGIRYQEHNSIDESDFSMAYTYAGGELTELDAGSFDEVVKQNVSGKVTWIAERNKYFGVAIIPRGIESQGAYMEGDRKKMADQGAQEFYNIALKMPYRGTPVETSEFTVFLGPFDYDIVKEYNIGLEETISLGAAWIIRPISVYVMMPLFEFLHWFIPNFGIVIIVFSIIIKVALYPLTKSSMASMQKMQALQPMMEEVREKYKDDPQKMNVQVMKLYKEYGINPAGGCLPLILQLPILYALWSTFRSAIELRQASFVGWIHDLSIPDVIATLPFTIPIFNIQKLSGLALLMGITMFIQQKMSVKDPRQKMMVWMMPLMMTLLFNSFPAGLNLYYLVFNLLSIGQQAWVTKQHKGEPLRKVDQSKRKPGLMERLSKDMPKLK